MEGKPRWHELIERAKNFHGDYNPFLEKAIKYEAFYVELHGLSEQIDVDIYKLRGLGIEQILKMIYKRTHNFIIISNNEFKIFEEDSPLYTNVFDACFLTTLCMYLHDTKRIKGMSVGKFIYHNSLEGYDIKSPTNYSSYENPDVSLIYDKTTLRQRRYRILSERSVYIERPEWSAISKDSEHEWAFQYVLDGIEDKNVRKDMENTYKRIGNLYNDINKALKSPIDDGYQGRFESAYKKFASKLGKIDYDKFLRLQRLILEHVCDNRRYYGINLYRFEKALRLYNITNEVKHLLRCKNAAEEEHIIKESVILKDIHFPKVYQDFRSSNNDMILRVATFKSFRDSIVGTCRLVIDEFVEKGTLGDDWEELFLNAINEMAEGVFYRPDEIDFIIKPGSQKMFEKVLSAPVNWVLDKYRS